MTWRSGEVQSHLIARKAGYMTKMDWDKVRRTTPGAEVPRLNRVPRSRVAQLGPFKARFPGWCQNCHRDFGVGAAIRYNAKHRLVHANGCSRKPT